MDDRATRQQSPRYRRISTAHSEVFEDELIVLHPGTRHAYQLNAVAAVLWDALQWPQSVPELSALLHEGFPSEDPENLRRQVQSLVASLLDGRLIEEA